MVRAHVKQTVSSRLADFSHQMPLILWLTRLPVLLARGQERDSQEETAGEEEEPRGRILAL